MGEYIEEKEALKELEDAVTRATNGVDAFEQWLDEWARTFPDPGTSEIGMALEVYRVFKRYVFSAAIENEINRTRMPENVQRSLDALAKHSDEVIRRQL